MHHCKFVNFYIHISNLKCITENLYYGLAKNIINSFLFMYLFKKKERPLRKHKNDSSIRNNKMMGLQGVML